MITQGCFIKPYYLKGVLFLIKSVFRSGSQPGVHIPLGVREKVTGGTQNLKNHSKEALLGRIFDLGVRKGHIILIWGYAECYNFDLGVENPCFKGTKNKIKKIFFILFLFSAFRKWSRRLLCFSQR